MLFRSRKVAALRASTAHAVNHRVVQVQAQAFEMQRQLGANGELLVSLDTDDQSTFQQLSFVARLASVSELKIASFGQYSIEIDVEEAI